MKKIPKFYWILLIISIVSVILRLIVANVLEIKDSQVLNPANTSDLKTYMTLAHQVLNGEFSGVYYYQPFYYAVFLPCAMLIFGATVNGVIFAQTILSGITVFLVGLIGKEIYGKRAGVVASILFAISNISIYYVAYHKIATLQTFNVTLISLFLILLIKSETNKNKIIYAVLSGIAMGIGCATRGNIYLLLFGIVPLLLVQGIRTKSTLKSLLSIILIFSFIIISQLPFIVHNSRILGKLTGASNASGAVLALGNTPEAPAGGRNYFDGNGPMEYPEAYHIFMTNETNGTRSVAMQIFDYFVERPLEYIELSFRKVLLFWSWGEIPNNVSYYEGRNKVNFFKYNILGESFVIITLGLAGLLLLTCSSKRNYQSLMLALIAIFYHLSIAFFYNLGRFRAPILADMAVFSGVFIVMSYENRKVFSKFKFNLVTLFFSAYIVFLGYYVYQKGYESQIMKLVRPNGTIIKTLEPNQKAIFDYGPYTFGSWQGFWIEEGALVEKVFAVKNLQQDGILKFRLDAKTGVGIANIWINGKVHSFNIAEAKDGFVEVPVKLIDGKVQIKLINFYGNPITNQVDLSIDKQRDYSRSFYNGELMPYEWIMRFYYKEQK